MKIAVTGKGGVGKTTLAASLAALWAQDGARVIALDADPDSNLAATLGFPDPDGIAPITGMKELIAERTGSQEGAGGTYFSLNPKVDDIPESFCPEHSGVRLLVMGGSQRQGGSGCLCPESAFVRALMAHLVFGREDVLIMDMEAGVEHLTRGTSRGMDALVVVVEPGGRSLETAARIRRLASELGIPRVLAVANKVRGDEDRRYVAAGLEGWEVAAFVPYTGDVVDSGQAAGGLDRVLAGPAGAEIRRLRVRLMQEFGASAR
jgi:CO dehydrogenase maturation factor